MSWLMKRVRLNRHCGRLEAVEKFGTVEGFLATGHSMESSMYIVRLDQPLGNVQSIVVPEEALEEGSSARTLIPQSLKERGLLFPSVDVDGCCIEFWNAERRCVAGWHAPNFERALEFGEALTKWAESCIEAYAEDRESDYDPPRDY